MKPMRIWHVGSSRSPNSVDGVNAMVWTLARAQAAAGHDVSVLLGERPDHASAAAARRMNVSLLHIPCNSLRFHARLLADRLHSEPPDVVHMHSVFVPRLATLARTLLHWKVPYVVTLHGGLAPQVLQRRKWRKALYSKLIERPRLRHAAAITLVGPGEEQQLKSFIPKYNNPMRWIPNPVDAAQLEGAAWTPAEKPRLVFLGRFDVYGKGVDLLVEIAKHLPDVEMHLYGTEDARSLHQLHALKAAATPNVFFHDPVYGPEKAAALSGATMYLQMSRWEGFPVAVTEAMYLGVPTGINEDLAIGPMFKEQDLGQLLPADPAAAAKKIQWALEHPECLRTWSANGRQYATEQLSPATAAEEHVRLYRKSFPGDKPSRWVEFAILAATLAGLALAL